MSLFDAETGENIGNIRDIKQVNMDAKYKTDYIMDKPVFVHNPTYTLNFNKTEVNKKLIDMFLCFDKSNMPDTYDIQFIKVVQARKHKKKRINKKWLKRYGYKNVIIICKGWKMRTDTDGNVEFIK